MKPMTSGKRWRRFVRRVLVAAVVSLSTAAAADPVQTDRPIHLLVNGTLSAEGGGSLSVPPGYFLTEPLWADLDTEVKRLQTAETRLGAENLSLRKSAEKVRWWPYLTAAAVGLAAGIAVGAKSL